MITNGRYTNTEVTHDPEVFFSLPENVTGISVSEYYRSETSSVY